LATVSSIFGQPRYSESDRKNIPARVVRIADTNVGRPGHTPFAGLIKLIPVTGTTPGDPIFISVNSGRIDYKLKPNEQDSYYLALFYSGDRIVAYEKWVIPDIPYSVTVDSVKQDIENSGTIDYTSPHDAPATISESAIVGLIADLGVRPVKGQAFSAGRVVVTNSAGMLDSVGGLSSDCVHTDGSSGPCGTGGTSAQTLSGDVLGAISSTLVAGIQGRPVSATPPSDGQPLVFNSATSMWTATAISGDVSGPMTKMTVVALQNKPVSYITPKDGQALVYNSANGWTPTTTPQTKGPLVAGTLGSFDASGSLVSSGCYGSPDSLTCGTGTKSSGISLYELSANGKNAFSIYGKDQQAADVCIVMPDFMPQAGQVLAASGTLTTTTDGRTCALMTWK
jgi:hypothetical protein